MAEYFIEIFGFATCGLGAAWILCMTSLMTYKHVLLAIAQATAEVDKAKKEADIGESARHHREESGAIVGGV